MFAALTVPALAKQGQAGQATKAAEQKPFKEIKFKLEWITTTVSQNPTTSTESVIFTTVDGQTCMTNNPMQSSDMYRRVTLHPDLQADGSYLVDVVVNEANKEVDNPRISTQVKVRMGDTKIVQTRTSKGNGYNYEYVFAITPVLE